MADENPMNVAVDRIMKTYDLMVSRTQAARDDARLKVTSYVAALFKGGETDPHRLTVQGLTYLREWDGSKDAAKSDVTER